MPFTFSHPAAVIPLAKNRGLVLSALVIGSMAPDVESFLHLSTDVAFAHSPRGLFLFCIPAGAAIFLLFHLLLRRPLLSLLPVAHQRRLHRVETPPLDTISRWGIILLSIWIGAVTHVLWDAATHEYGWFVQRWPALQAPVVAVQDHRIRLYTLLQHGGTLAGGIFLIHWYRRWYRRTHPSPSPPVQRFSEPMKYTIIAGIAGSGVFIGMIYGAVEVRALPGGFAKGYLFVKNSVLMGVPGILAAAVLFSLHWRLTIGRTDRSEGIPP